jgi:hypothetical protein
MPIQVSQEEALERVMKVHIRDNYDYSRMIYIGREKTIQIGCPIHGWFWQRYAGHVRGCGCPKCFNETKRGQTTKRNIQDLIDLANIKWNFFYDYSLLIEFSKTKEYKGIKTKVPIICPIHGMFWQVLDDHLRHKCNCCNPTKQMNKEEFVRRAEPKHKKGEYDYSKTIYINSKIEAIITHNYCRKDFLQTPNKHLQGHGCPYCYSDPLSNKEEFVIKAKTVHNKDTDGFDYIYERFIYKGNKTKGEIGCPKCLRYFWQNPNNHLNGQGCPNCKSSYGEKYIIKFLNDNKIEFTPQKSFNDCRYKNPLEFDFYIPSKNVLIEWDGIQHFEVQEAFGGVDAFILQEIKDGIKNKYCEANNIPLIRLPYWLLYFPEDIKEILLNEINSIPTFKNPL